MFTLNAFSTEIINEYKELNHKIVIEEIENQTEYRVTFYDDNSKIVNQLDNVFSSTGVWVEKLDDNHIAIYGGSFYAPDCFCYVLNVKNNKISEKIYLPVCFDIKNELVLSLYYEEIVIFNIYDKSTQYKIPEPNDICSYVQLWDRINRKETKLENGILYLSYKVFKDNEKLDTYNKYTEIIINDYLNCDDTTNKNNTTKENKYWIYILTCIAFLFAIAGALCIRFRRRV